jgi:hypothetical protein
VDLIGRQGLLLALAGVLLAFGVAMADARFEGEWSNGVHLAVFGVTFLAVFGLGAAAPPRERPPAAQSALLATGLVLLVPTLNYLGEVLGADEPLGNTGSLSWILALYVATAGGAALRYRSAVCALAGGVATIGLAVSVVNEISEPDDVDTFRWVLFAIALALTAGAVAVARLDRREGAPYGRHAVQLVNAAGFALIAVGGTVLVALIQFSFADDDGGGEELGAGWEMVLVFGAVALILYSILRVEPGPGYLGLVLATVAVIVTAFPGGEEDDDPSLVGWPLVLVGMALLAALLAFRLPREEAPPEPRSGPSAGPAPPPGAPPPTAPPPGPPPPAEPPGL